MPKIARVTDITATGDPIIGPGIPSVLIEGQPAAVVDDAVNGPACNGSIIDGNPMVLIGKRVAARVGSTVTGFNPSTGAAVTTTVATGATKMSIP